MILFCRVLSKGKRGDQKRSVWSSVGRRSAGRRQLNRFFGVVEVVGGEDKEKIVRTDFDEGEASDEAEQRLRACSPQPSLLPVAIWVPTLASGGGIETPKQQFRFATWGVWTDGFT